EQEVDYIKDAIPMENNNERLSYISNTIHQELNRGNIKSIGPTMETILNIEKYKKISTTLLPILSEPDILENPDKLFSLMEVFMEGKTEEEKKKMREMAQMLEIIKNLDSPMEENSSD